MKYKNYNNIINLIILYALLQTVLWTRKHVAQVHHVTGKAMETKLNGTTEEW